MDPITPAPAQAAETTVTTTPTTVPAAEKPTRFKPEPFPFMPTWPLDIYVAPESQTSSQPVLPTAPPQPAEPKAQSTTPWEPAIYFWPSPYYPQILVPTREQFEINSGQRFPGIAYGSDALWMEGSCRYSGGGPLSGARCP